MSTIDSDIPTPVPIDESIPSDLICSICMSIPSKPVTTPCHHLFCKDCIRQALSVKKECPVDRCRVQPNQMRDLIEGTLPWRLWANIRVKCANHDNGCLWTGGIVDFLGHAESCTKKKRNCDNGSRSTSEELRQYKQLNITLQDKVRQLEEEIEALKMQLDENQGGADIESLGLFDEYYDYSRDDIVKLSQLISLRLEDKPDYVDRNKIFNCLHERFKDWERGYIDNPEYYEINMKMLIATCYASNWFSSKQHERIGIMLDQIVD
eukprot:scaffold29195_cov69-Cyclotella_meneghiniana.AAC.10